MSDRNANDAFFDSADDAFKQDEFSQDQDVLRDQDLDQASGGMRAFKTGGDAAEADNVLRKNDKPESDMRM